MTKKPKGHLETRPMERLSQEPHGYDEDPRTDRCKTCGLPHSNRLHDPSNRRQPTAEQRAADLSRLGERDED